MFGCITWSDDTSDAGKAEFLAGVADGTITLTAQGDLTGGAIGTLDLIASEKGLPRAEDETDAQLRRRIKRLPLTVTRANILQAINEVLAPYGVTATMVEWFEGGLIVGEWIGGEGHPTGAPSFCILIPSLKILLLEQGTVVADDWIVGDDYVGEDYTAINGVINAVQAVVDRAKLGGVCGVVVMEE